MSKKKWSFYYKLIPYKELSNIQIIEADSKRIVEIREKKMIFLKYTMLMYYVWKW